MGILNPFSKKGREKTLDMFTQKSINQKLFNTQDEDENGKKVKSESYLRI